MEQEKIDETRATPVPDTAAAKGRTRQGAPMWLQLVLSLVVVVIAVGIAALFLPTANDLVKRVGLTLPLLTASASDAQAAPAAAPQGQARQGQAQGQSGGQGQGRPGGAGGYGGGSRTAVVVAASATTGLINNKLTSIGEGTAESAVTVNSASGGTLMTVEVKPGQHVEAGAKIATLDSDTQQNAYDKAKLALADADATLTRTQALAKSNNVAASQVDAAQLADDNAKLALQAAQIALNDRIITTPVAGTVGLIQVTPGNLINAQSIVTTVADSSNILVNFWVPERYASQVVVGMPLDANSAALPGKDFTGTVTAVDNQIDPASRTLQVQGTLPNPEGLIKSGMSFSVDLLFQGETFPDVDPLSIQWSNSGAYVWKIVDGKVVKGMVDIIQRNSDGVLVKGDVKPGDQVVTQGVLQLTDNAAVRLLDAGTGGASAQPVGNGQPAGGKNTAPASGAPSAAASGASNAATASSAAGG